MAFAEAFENTWHILLSRSVIILPNSPRTFSLERCRSVHIFRPRKILKKIAPSPSLIGVDAAEIWLSEVGILRAASKVNTDMIIIKIIQIHWYFCSNELINAHLTNFHEHFAENDSFQKF